MRKLILGAFVALSLIAGGVFAGVSTTNRLIEVVDRNGTSASVLALTIEGRTTIFVAMVDKHRITRLNMMLTPDQSEKVAMALIEAAKIGRGTPEKR
jgi:SH3-like domain-containing protein